MSPTLLAAIASPRRQEILRLVWDDELNAGAIHRAMPDVTFGAVSLHLRALTEAGLVRPRAEGRHRFYRARPEALGVVGDALKHMWDDALWRLKLAAELEQTRRGPKPRRRGGAAKKRSERVRHGTLLPALKRSERVRHGTLLPALKRRGT